MTKTRALLILLMFISTFSLFGDIQDHLKKARGKSKKQQLRNIDFIYMINLDQRPEKYELSLHQLKPYGIVPYRFSAVNGWELTGADINDLGVKCKLWMRNETRKWATFYPLEGDLNAVHEIFGRVGQVYFCHCMTRGAIGIVLSHLSILQDALNAGYQTIWVMEDDVEVIRDPRILSDLIDKLDRLVGKDGWDILFTDRDTKNQKGEYVACKSFAWRPNFTPGDPQRFALETALDNNFKQIGARYGAYSMIVRRSGMEKILNFIKTYRIFLPYDMEFYLPDNIRMFGVLDDVVSTQPRAASDNGIQGYLNKPKTN